MATSDDMRDASTPAPARSLGEDLRDARLARGEDLDTVSRALKIRAEHLDSLEHGRSEALPGRTYALGFVRAYAEYLGLDPKESVERYKAELVERTGIVEGQFTYPTQDVRLPGAILIGVLLAVAMAYGGYYLVSAADRAAEPPVAAVPDRLVAQRPAPALVPLPAPPGEAPAAPEAAPVPDGAPAAAAAAAAPAAPVLPEGRAYGARNTDSRVTLRLHRPAKILVQGADSTVFINRTLVAGDLYLAPNMVGLTLSTPDSGAIEVILDGASLGMLGQRGAIVDGLSLNPQDLVDRTAANTEG